MDGSVFWENIRVRPAVVAGDRLPCNSGQTLQHAGKHQGFVEGGDFGYKLSDHQLTPLCHESHTVPSAGAERHRLPPGAGPPAQGFALQNCSLGLCC
jgi:hypothetical protein